jgi:hypothetical protein
MRKRRLANRNFLRKVWNNWNSAGRRTKIFVERRFVTGLVGGKIRPVANRRSFDSEDFCPAPQASVPFQPGLRNLPFRDNITVPFSVPWTTSASDSIHPKNGASTGGNRENRE